jgi:hypothetical protein
MDIRLDGALSDIDSARWIRDRLQIPIGYSTVHTDMRTLSAVQTTESSGYVAQRSSRRQSGRRSNWHSDEERKLRYALSAPCGAYRSTLVPRVLNDPAP